DLERVIDNGAARYVQPSVIKIGLTAALHLSRRTIGTNVICAPQVAFVGPGYLASLHLAASQQTEVTLERLYLELAHVPYANTVPVESGWITVPDAPGLGADPEPELTSGQFSH